MVGSAEVVSPPADPAPAFNHEISQEANEEDTELRKNDAEKPRQMSLQSRVTLTDGSVVNGALQHHFVPAVSETLGSFRLDLRVVESIARLPDDAEPSTSESESLRVVPCAFCVSFRNGDRLTVRLEPEGDRFVLDTLLGPLPVPLASISSLVILNTPTEALLYHCTFDNETSIVHPAVGPSGRFLGGEFVPGKVGKALRIWSDKPAAQTDFPGGALGPRGTIEFWAKMENASPETVFGDGGNPRFFCLWIQDDISHLDRNPRSSYLQWSGNDGGGRSGLCAMIQGMATASEEGWGIRRYPDFLGNPAAWHHYAIVWDENGVTGSDNVIVVYVDGKRIDTAGGDKLSSYDKNFRRFLESSVLLGFPQRENQREPAARHVSFLIDEFKIWSISKTDYSFP